MGKAYREKRRVWIGGGRGRRGGLVVVLSFCLCSCDGFLFGFPLSLFCRWSRIWGEGMSKGRRGGEGKSKGALGVQEALM